MQHQDRRSTEDYVNGGNLWATNRRSYYGNHPWCLFCSNQDYSSSLCKCPSLRQLLHTRLGAGLLPKFTDSASGNFTTIKCDEWGVAWDILNVASDRKTFFPCDEESDRCSIFRSLVTARLCKEKNPWCIIIIIFNVSLVDLLRCILDANTFDHLGSSVISYEYCYNQFHVHFVPTYTVPNSIYKFVNLFFYDSAFLELLFLELQYMGVITLSFTEQG